jgi:hypothetical protein
VAGPYGLNVRLEGATVRGLATPIVDRLLQTAVAEVADYTKHEVLMQLDHVLQHPTGYYESHIKADREGVYTYRVHDDMVIYGPWLEGVGSRNYPVTKFRGYHTFRIVRNRMAQKAKAVIAAHVARTVAEL